MTLPRPDRADVALAAVLGVAVESELALANVRDTPLVGGLLLGLVLCSPLAWRRVAPLGALVVPAAGAIGLALAGTPPDELSTTSVLVAVLGFSIGAHLPRRRALAGLAGLVGLILGVVATALGASARRSGVRDGKTTAGLVLGIVAIVVAIANMVIAYNLFS